MGLDKKSKIATPGLWSIIDVSYIVDIIFHIYIIMTFSSLVNIFPLRGCSYVLLNLKVYKIVRGLMAYYSIGCLDSGKTYMIC